MMSGCETLNIDIEHQNAFQRLTYANKYGTLYARLIEEG